MVLPQYINLLGLRLDVVALLPYVAMVCVLAFILLVVPGLIWIERVVMALMQDRIGLNRVGPRGLLQPIADGIKLFFKEDILPANVDRRLFYLAPVLALIPALAAGATIPFTSVNVAGVEKPVAMVVGDVNIGILFVLALASLQVYGIVLGGWSSNNKYSLLGGLRSAAQVISYELAMSLAIMSGLLMAGSLSLVTIVEKQQGGFWNWNFAGYFPFGLIATVVYIIAMIAETNRAPFDLPEAESELIAGFHTEYSSMKFAVFFMGEYASMLIVSGVATALWFGGWDAPLPFLRFVPGWIWFIIKVMSFIFFYVWLRATLPRLRYDALMALGWKRLLPAALVVLFAIATWETLRTPPGPPRPAPVRRGPAPMGAPVQGGGAPTTPMGAPTTGSGTPSAPMGAPAPGGGGG